MKRLMDEVLFGLFWVFSLRVDNLHFWRFPLLLSWRAVGQDHSDLVADLLKELSNHNERSEERKGALVELLKITREDNLAVWDEHFKTILLLLLETLSDKDVCCLSCEKIEHTCSARSSNWFMLLPSAHNPSPGPSGPEGNPEEPAGPLQKLRRVNHHEDPGGSQRLSQRGQCVHVVPLQWGRIRSRLAQMLELHSERKSSSTMWGATSSLSKQDCPSRTSNIGLHQRLREISVSYTAESCAEFSGWLCVSSSLMRAVYFFSEKGEENCSSTIPFSLKKTGRREAKIWSVMIKNCFCWQEENVNYK